MEKINYKDKTVAVIDHGLHPHVAIKLAETFGTVLYSTDWCCSFPTCEPLLVGEGFEGVTRTKDFWKECRDADLFVVTDIYYAGLQQELLRQGKRVWGPRDGDKLEINRWQTKEMLPSLGLPKPPGVRIQGIKKLRDYLKKHDDQYVKVSGLRGMMETWHHTNYELSEYQLDVLEKQISGVKNVMMFIVDAPVVVDPENPYDPPTVEVGYDGWSIDGQYPEVASFGIEAKDCGLISVVREYKDFPEPIVKVMDAFAPVLQDFYYRGFLCAEIRHNQNGPHMIDWASRCGSPSSEVLMEFYGNMPDVFWFGAEGKLVRPEALAKVGIEVIVKSPDADCEEWKTVQITDEARPWVKLHNWARVDGVDLIAPQEYAMKEFGAIVGIGDTFAEAKAAVEKHCEGVKSSSVEFKMDSIDEVMKEIEKAKLVGIDFGIEVDTEPKEEEV
jgi:phosphoribosylamine-glycine ligase